MAHAAVRLWVGLVITWLALSGAAAAQSCGCNPLPSEGIYGGPVPLTLTHLDGDDETCPTRVRVHLPRQGAPDINVVLHCQPGENTWTGSEPSPFGAAFMYILTPEAPPLDMASGGYAAQLAGARAMAETVSLLMILPPKLLAIGKSSETHTFSLAGEFQAAECICNKVKEELDWARTMQSAYSDTDLIAQALAAGIRGTRARENFWMDDARQLHRFDPANHEISYADQVSAKVSAEYGGVTTPGKIVPQSVKAATTIRSPGDLEPGATAQVSPTTCKIKLKSPAAVVKECVPDIVVKALFAHESQHQRLCQTLNVPSVYKSPDGEEVNWRDGITGPYADGSPAPLSGYGAWSQNPSNHSMDEAAAYAAEASVLQNWLDAHCS